MTHVLTLVAAPATAPLTADLIALAEDGLRAAGAAPRGREWLAAETACDIAFTGVLTQSLDAALADRLSDQPLDLAMQPATGRRKGLLIADMDSTIVTAETLDELAAKAGFGTEVSAITARAMAGELDFAGALRERVAMLAGLPLQFLDETRDEITLTSGARALVQTMKQHGAVTALVSGGFTHFTDWVRSACGFDRAHANRLAVADGHLAGSVIEPILDRHSKLRTLQALCAENSLPLEAACAVGDGANDLDMLAAAGLGVAFHGKPKVRAAAPFRVDHTDLTALLYFQGYRRQDIAS